MLVEPACGSALAAVYFKPETFEISKKPIIVIVCICGGNMAIIELFETWKNSLKQ